MQDQVTPPSYYRTIIHLLIPIAIQAFFNSALALVDNMFVGQIDEVAVTAVSLASQVFFILSLIYFGINSGSAIFTAQFWGNNDSESIRKVVGVNLLINISLGLVVTLLAELLPEMILGLYTRDQAVITAGAPYLRIYAIGYVFLGITQALYFTLRSTQNVKIPMFVNSLALIVNTCLGYILIFGKLGVTPMGIEGAAIANATARILEFIALFVILTWSKSFLFRDYKTMFPIRREFVLRFLKYAAPVALNELLWSVGFSTYNSIYAHIGTDSAAATNIAFSLENLFFVPFLGLGNACAILIGNQIGAEDKDKAYHSAARSLRLTVITAIGMGLIMFIAKDWILQIYHISAITRDYAALVITWLSIALIAKSWNMVVLIGILRAGGDTRFALGLELATMWLYGVPAAWISANVFQLPVFWVVPIVLIEELLKAIISYTRFRSKKWIHHLSHSAV